ncbi:hypothetical protein BDD14_5092 [Edaphobacter modestus]|uniref:Uncharacterized protein n=1 Tax=Edaphobacter modestus TaxID=388466 RepID=A0A4Q7Z1C0_9BACT|nr:hypothetical protein BDD14_5092 [Edaphobacter modestus]
MREASRAEAPGRSAFHRFTVEKQPVSEKISGYHRGRRFSAGKIKAGGIGIAPESAFER